MQACTGKGDGAGCRQNVFHGAGLVPTTSSVPVCLPVTSRENRHDPIQRRREDSIDHQAIARCCQTTDGGGGDAEAARGRRGSPLARSASAPIADRRAREGKHPVFVVIRQASIVVLLTLRVRSSCRHNLTRSVGTRDGSRSVGR